MTLLEIQLLWGSSTCGRSIEQFVFDEMSKEIKSLKKIYNDLATEVSILKSQSKISEFQLNQCSFDLRETKSHLEKCIEGWGNNNDPKRDHYYSDAKEFLKSKS